MLLVVDVRNTDTVLGVVDGDHIVARWEVRTSDRTSDEWVMLIHSLLRPSGFVLTSSVLASVVPEATRALRPALPDLCGSEPVVVGPGVKTGLAIDLDNAREVGADRVASAIGAIDRYGSPVIVVGLGTATTLDVVDAAQRFRGGVIAVGVEVAAEALVVATSALRRVELRKPEHVIGRSTVEAVQSGAVFGFAALVDGMASRLVAEMGEASATVVATGALASLIAPECAMVDVIDDDLTLWGLTLIERRNR